MLPEQRSLLGHLGAESLYRSTGLLMSSQTGILGQRSQLQNYNQQVRTAAAIFLVDNPAPRFRRNHDLTDYVICFQSLPFLSMITRTTNNSFLIPTHNSELEQHH